MTERELKEHSRKQKMASAKSLAKLGKDMRYWQRQYFKFKSGESLRKAKKLEEQFDRSVEAILKT